jgi:hypothetical protein
LFQSRQEALDEKPPGKHREERIETRDGKLVRVVMVEEDVRAITIVDQAAELITRAIRDYKRELLTRGGAAERVEVEFGTAIATALFFAGLLKDEAPDGL